MRTTTAAILMVLGFGAMAGTVLWARAQTDSESVSTSAPPPGHAPGPGWLHARNTN